MNVIGVSALPRVGTSTFNDRPHWVTVLDSEDSKALVRQLEAEQRRGGLRLTTLEPRSGTLPREPFGMLAEAEDGAMAVATLRRALPTYGPLLLECLGFDDWAGLEPAIHKALCHVLETQGADATWHDVVRAAEQNGLKSHLLGTLERGHLLPVSDHQMLALEMMRTLVRFGGTSLRVEPPVILVRGNLAEFLQNIPARSLWSLAMLLSEARRLGVLFVFSTGSAAALDEPDFKLLCCYASHVVVSDSKRGALPPWVN